MSNTATMLRKTEAELRDALAEVARLRKVNADLIAMANRARMAQFEAEGALDVPACRGCVNPSSTVWCVECAKHARCTHGNSFGECSACDVEGDFAFDAMREDATTKRR